MKHSNMIILLGYMGSGKSSVGQFIGQNNNLSYCDLDDYIQEKEDMSISEVFQTRGEIYFRTKEHQYLKEILNDKTYDILSLGGGTPCYAGNMDLIKNQNLDSFYLKVDLEKLTERLFNQKNDRPLITAIKSKAALKDFIRKHLFEREFYYRQAKHIINVSNFSVDKISGHILNQLK